MDLFDQIIARKEKIAVVGLGYVGLPIAIAFARQIDTIGFDVNSHKIELYRSGIDPTREVGNEAVQQTRMTFSSDPHALREAKFIIVAVPTPVNQDHTPDLTPLQSASRLVGENLTKGTIVVFESTVYPGVTEEVCVPILEQASGLKAGLDFKAGYSPERINPGDKNHTLENIVKVVSGMDEDSLETIAKVYSLVVKAGVFRATSIKVAEAAKVIENSQRDINIAFMNELSIIFNKMNIDTRDVLAAAGTKWNFLKFVPGLVGGHCIGVDPYYLTHKAEELGYHSQIILAGRKINDDMGIYITENLVKLLIKAKVPVHEARIAIIGFTFKENVPDTRNTKVIDIFNRLREYDVTPLVIDPVADAAEAHHEYGIQLGSLDHAHDMDAVVFAVNHEVFSSLTTDQIGKLFKSAPAPRVVVDVKGLFDRKAMEQSGYLYWTM